jgi:uncharacterized membrane protein
VVGACSVVGYFVVMFLLLRRENGQKLDDKFALLDVAVGWLEQRVEPLLDVHVAVAIVMR